jgi:hypothetical protein
MTIHEFNANLNKLNLTKLAFEVVVDKEQAIKDLQTTQLAFTGLNRKGRKLRKYRSRAYAIFKNKMNPYPGLGTPDLKLTGSFLRRLELGFASNKEFVIYSTDEKFEALKEKYGEDFLGLNKDSIVTFKTKHFKTPYVDEIRASLWKR